MLIEISVCMYCCSLVYLHLQEIDALVSQSEAITCEKNDQVCRLSFVAL